LPAAFAGYENRPGQLAMADAVERTLAEDRVLVCEAGTGTGKTLAYLVPAILSGRKVVISTATRALQEQIYGKDLPLIRRTLGLDVHAALMKGLGNYLCLRRYKEFRASPESGDPRFGRALGVLEDWAARTQAGDVGEISGLAEDDPIWAQVSSSSETRIGSPCDFYQECFVTRMKRDAEQARLVIVNHHLFFADLALRGPHAGGALPEYDSVIFDEAHQLEDIATDFFGVRVSSARVLSMLRDAERAFAGAGISDRLLRKGEGDAIAHVAREAQARFFAELAAAHGAAGEGRIVLSRDVWSGSLLTAYHKLDTTMEALAAFAESRATSEAVELAARRAKQLRDDLAAIVDGGHNQVTWAEVRTRSASVGASPIELSSLFKAKLFSRVPAVVLTSATLATQQGFSFLRSRLGLDGDDPEVQEIVVPSPFDYEAHALVYVPRDLPDPGEPSFIEAARARIQALVEASGGGAFILATSKRVMLALHASLRGLRCGPLFVQGEAPKGVLLDRFKRAEHAVLVATMSFWEGVDVPGHALRLVIIDKIPFAVPTDPVVTARSAAIEAAGKNPFTAYQVPTAAIALKQGFGRLIRTRRDAGIVAILDKRVHTRGYGRALLESLPPARRTDQLSDALRFAERMKLAAGLLPDGAEQPEP
jgi:ATP-dependent DNA helicase DinG